MVAGGRFLSNNDEDLVTLSAQSFGKVGREGVITVVEEQRRLINLCWTLNREVCNSTEGYLSPITRYRFEKSDSRFRESYILLYDKSFLL